MFTKAEIKAHWAAYKQAEIEAGRPAPRASINLALLISSSALFSQKDWGGRDYMPHPLHVAFNNTNSDIKIMIGILHDVVEDSDWEIEDIREIDFHERVCVGVDAMTIRENEKYLDFIVRCGLTYLNEEGPEDAIDKKIEDLKHNSDKSRTRGIRHSDYSDLKLDAYNIALYYLIDIKKGRIAPGTPIIEFLRNDPAFTQTPQRVNEVLDQFSSDPERLPEPVVFDFAKGPAL